MIQPEQTFRCQKIKAADDVRLLDSSDRYDPAKAVVVPRTSLVQDHMGNRQFKPRFPHHRY